MPIVMSESGWAEHKDLLAKHQTFSDFEYKVDFADKKLRWFSASGEPVFDSNGVFKGYRGTGKDISERKRSEEQIQHMALHDALTGLPNRTLLQDRIAHAIAVANRQSHALWVLFIDLDRFKFINDSLGHKAGDVLLMTIAQRLQTTLREHDTVARIGGDEFVLVLPDLAASPLTARVIQRILDAVSEPMLLEGQQIVIGCSIGIAIYPMDGVDEERLLEHADTAMYRAKKNGRNNFQFYTALMNDGASERLSIENGLRHALANEELVLHYQPQVDLLTNKIVGVEALIRWQHPTRSFYFDC
jgi:diguanylate cyclase (GGDEF)-like protein